MSHDDDGGDNAETFSLFGTLKVEWRHGMRFGTRLPARAAVMDWIALNSDRRPHLAPS